MSNSLIEASFQPTYVERLRAEWSLLANMPGLMLMNAMFPLAGLFLLWLAVTQPASTPAWAYGAGFASMAFVPFMFLYNSYRGHKATVERGPYTYTFDPEGVHVRTPLAQATYRWPAILRVRERRGNLLLFYNRRCAYFVPTRALPDGGSIGKIEKYAREGGASQVGN